MGSEKINNLQLLQQNLQTVGTQKQLVQNQLLEIDSALEQLVSTDKAYRIVGKIMLASDKESLIKDIKEKKETFDVRLNNFSKQEKKLQENIDNLQKEVMDELKKDKK